MADETVNVANVRSKDVHVWTWSPRRPVHRISLEAYPPRALLFVASLQCNGKEQILIDRPLPVDGFRGEGEQPSLMAAQLPPIRPEQNALRIVFQSKDYRPVRVRMLVWYVRGDQ